MAHRLGERGRRVLVLEAWGTGGQRREGPSARGGHLPHRLGQGPGFRLPLASGRAPARGHRPDRHGRRGVPIRRLSDPAG
ncbi:hypothetical protein [Streptomyces flavotricini]|uniref:hypothetical protein n=1 Tax=Streptomyces flavotricini TaxID=66888 RepID=UPI001E615D3F|nr:hypothetical protein [Streptomyces flavotricini]